MDPLRTLVERLDIEEPCTALHGRAVAHWSARIAAHLRLSRDEVSFVSRCGLLHDIGKLYVPLELIRAPRVLDQREREAVAAHVIKGDEAIAVDPELRIYRDAVRWHHERYDGRGYPDGLRGQRIPLAARIVAVADAYDAMTGQRPYRFPMMPDRALLEIERHRGTQFDPEIADAMLTIVGDLVLRPVAV
jgi:HD-GYP domain-containing protein (c-di-GMP phosphodiesterase class II)